METFLFVLTLIKTCLDFGFVQFSKIFDMPKVWPSAITQRRAQIQYTAFEEVLGLVTGEMHTDKRFEGFRIIAFNGMTGELPRIPELIKEYGLMDSSFYPQFHAVSAHDVLNGYFLWLTGQRDLKWTSRNR